MVETLGNMGDFIGGIGVVVTLAYLALQIRRSNLLSTAESHRWRMEVASPAILAITQDADLARIFREGLIDRDALAADDRVRFDMLLGQMIGGLIVPINDEALLGHKGDSQTLGNRENIRAFLTSPGGASWWAENKRRIAPVDCSVIDEILSTSQSSGA